MCVLIYTLGILYIIFVLEEIKVELAKANKVEGVENPGFTAENGAQMMKSPVGAMKATEEVVNKGFFREFFDPTLAKDLVEVVFKKRSGHLRKLLFLILVCNFVFVASLGENDLTYLYTRLKINWSGVEFALHITYGTVVALVGTLLMVGVFSKIFGISDAMIGIISTIFTLISKPVYVSSFVNQQFSVF